MKTRDEQIEFIRLNGPRIAACAWNGFQEKGRGFVCVLSDLENESLRVCPFDFMPATVAAKLLKPWIGSREKGMVDDYDPQVEVIICFVKKAEGERTDLDSYRLKTRPSPPQAAEQE